MTVYQDFYSNHTLLHATTSRVLMTMLNQVVCERRQRTVPFLMKKSSQDTETRFFQDISIAARDANGFPGSGMPKKLLHNT